LHEQENAKMKTTKRLGQVMLALLVSALLLGRAEAGVVRMLAERDTPSTGSDFFLLSYPSLADALAGTGLMQQVLPLPLVDTFSISGMFIESESGDVDPDPNRVPEPPVLSLVAGALAFCAAMRRRRAARCK